MQVRSRAIVLLLSSLLTGGGAWAGYEIYKPRTVQALADWKGLKLVGEDNTDLWKALYFQNQSELSSTVSDHEQLKKSCLNTLKKSLDYENKNFDYFSKFCVNDLKSRKARIIATGFDVNNFLKNDDEFKVAFTVNRYSNGFLALLGNSDLTNESEVDEDDKKILQLYQNYCETILKEDGDNIAVAKQVCSKYSYSNAEEVARQEGYKAKEKNELENEWEKYKQEGDLQKKKYVVGSTLLIDIKEDDGKEDSWIPLTQKKELFTKQFEKWCNVQKIKKIYEKEFFKNVYPKYTARCMNKVGESKLNYNFSSK